MALPERIEEAWRHVADHMIQDMQRDDLMWFRDWVSAPPPRNGVTGTVYQGRNRVLLMDAMATHKFTDPRFMTFRTAKRAGYNVRRGEHSCALIEKWKLFAYLKEDPDKRIKQPRTEEEWDAVKDDPDYGVSSACVGTFSLFNASQIEGIEPYEPEVNRVSSFDDRVVDALEDEAICPVNEVPQDEAFYRPARDEITLPSRTQFSSFGGFARTLLHEQGHATGAKSRLDRPQSTSFGSKPYAREELVAELSSVFSAQTLGIDFGDVESGEFTSSRYWTNHAAYLKSWSKKFDDPAAELRAVVPKAAAASEMIIENYREAGIVNEHGLDIDKIINPEQESLESDIAAFSREHDDDLIAPGAPALDEEVL